MPELTSFWPDGFWAQGFWLEGFWPEDVEPPSVGALCVSVEVRPGLNAELTARTGLNVQLEAFRCEH